MDSNSSSSSSISTIPGVQVPFNLEGFPVSPDSYKSSFAQAQRDWENASRKLNELTRALFRGKANETAFIDLKSDLRSLKFHVSYLMEKLWLYRPQSDIRKLAMDILKLYDRLHLTKVQAKERANCLASNEYRKALDLLNQTTKAQSEMGKRTEAFREKIRNEILEQKKHNRTSDPSIVEIVDRIHLITLDTFSPLLNTPPSDQAAVLTQVMGEQGVVISHTTESEITSSQQDEEPNSFDTQAEKIALPDELLYEKEKWWWQWMPVTLEKDASVVELERIAKRLCHLEAECENLLQFFPEKEVLEEAPVGEVSEFDEVSLRTPRVSATPRLEENSHSLADYKQILASIRQHIKEATGKVKPEKRAHLYYLLHLETIAAELEKKMNYLEKEKKVGTVVEPALRALFFFLKSGQKTESSEKPATPNPLSEATLSIKLEYLIEASREFGGLEIKQFKDKTSRDKLKLFSDILNGTGKLFLDATHESSSKVFREVMLGKDVRELSSELILYVQKNLFAKEPSPSFVMFLHHFQKGIPEYLSKKLGTSLLSQMATYYSHAEKPEKAELESSMEVMRKALQCLQNPKGYFNQVRYLTASLMFKELEARKDVPQKWLEEMEAPLLELRRQEPYATLPLLELVTIEEKLQSSFIQEELPLILSYTLLNRNENATTKVNSFLVHQYRPYKDEPEWPFVAFFVFQRFHLGKKMLPYEKNVLTILFTEYIKNPKCTNDLASIFGAIRCEELFRQFTAANVTFENEVKMMRGGQGVTLFGTIMDLYKTLKEGKVKVDVAAKKIELLSSLTSLKRTIEGLGQSYPFYEACIQELKLEEKQSS